MLQDKIEQVLKILSEVYKDVQGALVYNTPYELMVATILSAQCTDVRVNIVTRELFQVCNTPEEMMKMPVERLEEIIKTCGFYKTKARHILEASRQLVEEYGGEVPADIEQMTHLAGVGRKTANVIASHAFGIDAIAVDTHVFRVSNRIGLANSKDVEHTEQDLMRNIPKKNWSDAHLWLIWHGRRVCHARKPDCPHCPILDLCEYPQKQQPK